MSVTPPRSPLRRGLALFLPLALLSGMAMFAIYAAVQHVYRSDANDPQYQLAEDAARRLTAGAKPADVVPVGAPVDMATSLAPFVAVYDAQGNVLAANVRLDGQAPTPPQGVLDNAQARGVDVVTWEPRSGVRMALVAFPWHGGTVAAGRSLRLVEQRETDLELLLLVGLVVSLALLLAASVLVASVLWPNRPETIAGGRPPEPTTPATS